MSSHSSVSLSPIDSPPVTIAGSATPPSTPLSSSPHDGACVMNISSAPAMPLSLVVEGRASSAESGSAAAAREAKPPQPMALAESLAVTTITEPEPRSAAKGSVTKAAAHRRSLSESAPPQLVLNGASPPVSATSSVSVTPPTSASTSSAPAPRFTTGVVSLEPVALLNAVYSSNSASPSSGHRYLVQNSSFSSLSSLVSIGTEFSVGEVDGSSVKSFEVENGSFSRSCASLDRGTSEDSGVASISEEGRGRKRTGIGVGSGLSAFIGSALVKFSAATAPKPKVNGLSRRPSTPSSTTGLILHDRPNGLPAKDPKESKKHAAEYSKVIERIKKDESEQKKRAEDEEGRRLHREMRIRMNLDTWRNDILPNWHRRLLRTDRQRRNLLWDGVPGPLRDKAWPLMVGNDLGITRDIYEQCSRRLEEVRRSSSNGSASPDGEKESTRCASCAAAFLAATPVSVSESPITPSSTTEPSALKRQQQTLNLICTDIVRTFPKLSFFQADGPQHQDMITVLGAYAFGYNPEVGYCQGMSFLAAVLLLNLPSPYEAFVCLANMLNRPVLNSLYCGDLGEKFNAYRAVFDHYMMRVLPDLASHFQHIGLDSRIYLLSWLLTLFSSTLPLECSFRVWDLYLVDGDSFLLRAALGLLRCLRPFLLKQCYDLSAEFLTKMIPDETLCPTRLFQAIRSVPLDNHEFQALLEEAQLGDSED